METQPRPHEGDPRVEASMQLLETGVDKIHDSEEFKRFLEFSASFHKYSPNNQILIWMQKPEARMVAGFHDWKKKGRYVRAGEKAIKIFAPMLKKQEDPATGDIIEHLTGYRIVNVFDVSSTDGQELPQLARPEELGSESENGLRLFTSEREWLAGRGVPVFMAPSPNYPHAKGSYMPGGEGKSAKIYVRPDLPIDMAAKTLTHESAHYVADHKWGTPKEEAESVAEGAAFVVAHHYGLDTGEYSFGYITHWNQDRELFKQKLGEIGHVAKTIISGVDGVADRAGHLDPGSLEPDPRES